MNRGKFKFNAILRVLLLAGAVYANELPGENKAVPEKEMVAPSDKEFAGFAEKQFLYGVYCKEKLKDDKIAYYYLELAAKQNHRNAWIYLGNCYFDRKEEHHSYLLWAKLCYMAAERITPDAETEFLIGILEGIYGNLDEFKKWMKLAADKGFARASELLVDKKFHAEIIAIGKNRTKQANPDALKQAINSNFEKIRQITGTTGPEVLDLIANRPAVSNISKMIKLPQPAGITMPNWNYNSQATEALIAENLMADREGDMRWMSDEFKQQPIWENLFYPNPTIRVINFTHESELTKSLDKSGFKRCSGEETKRLIKPFMDPDMPKNFYDNDVVWSLGNDLYFRIHTDTSGRWMLRDYQFFLHKNGKTIRVETFPNPPDTADAAMIAGIIQNNSDCWNNLGVKYAEGEMNQVFRCDDEAEEILKELVKRRHAVGTYNLAVFYQNRGKKEEAKKYFALAKEFAGSSSQKNDFAVNIQRSH
ncbi:MAG: sel1 repeat family protein [Lentisphaeria bacterium]|nr:sel1 repeat family protein [Lentisphaeria bacterium]